MEDWKLRALENVSEGIVITDATKEDNPIIYVNQGFRNITGYTDEDVLSKNCRFMRGKDTNSETTQKIRECLKTHKPFSAEILNYKKDGSAFWNLLNITPLRDSAGNVTHFVGIQLDITRTKKAEEALEYSRRKLLAAEQLGATVAISGALAHEIFNPLTVITNRSASMRKLLQKCEDNEPNKENLYKFSSHLTNIEEMTERIQMVVQRLEDFYEGSKVKETERIDICLCIESAIAQFEEQCRRKNIKIFKEFSGALICTGNRYEFDSLFKNLFTNAIEAISEQIHAFIKINGTILNDRAIIQFTDSAPILSDDLATKIFRPFFTTKVGGTALGLGLPVASMLALKNSGLLTLERKNERNTFVVSFPLIQHQEQITNNL